MKYETEVRIALPRERVIELFANRENVPEWHPGFMEMKPVSGTPGEKDAVTEFIEQIGKRTVTTVETITSCSFPDEWSATYENKESSVIIDHFFEAASQAETLWTVRTNRRSKGLMRIMDMLVPDAYREETMKHMESFKSFAEGQ